MKHIKTWHSMNALFEGFNTDDYYTSISSDTAFKLIGHLKNKFENTKTLTDKEILILSSLYSNIEINHKNHEIDISISSGDDGILNIVLSHKNVYTETLQYQNIVKLDDDWFILIHSIKGTGLVYFKCDQLDGLIKCIEDHKMKFPD